MCGKERGWDAPLGFTREVSHHLRNNHGNPPPPPLCHRQPVTPPSLNLSTLHPFISSSLHLLISSSPHPFISSSLHPSTCPSLHPSIHSFFHPSILPHLNSSTLTLDPQFGFSFLSSLATARGRVEACIAVDFIREAPSEESLALARGAGVADLERVVVVHSDDRSRLQTLARLRAQVQVSLDDSCAHASALSSGCVFG